MVWSEEPDDEPVMDVWACVSFLKGAASMAVACS